MKHTKETEPGQGWESMGTAVARSGGGTGTDLALIKAVEEG